MEFDLSPEGLVKLQDHLKDLLGTPRYDEDGKEAWGLPTLVTHEMKRLMEAHPSMTCANAAMLAQKRYAPAKIALALCRELMKKFETKKKNKKRRQGYPKERRAWEKQWIKLI